MLRISIDKAKKISGDISFLFVWVLLPFLLRIITFVLQPSLDSTNSLFYHPLAFILLGMSQDMIIAASIYALYRVLRRTWPNHLNLAAFISAGLFFCIMSFLLFDFFLEWKLGIRFSKELFSFFLDPAPFLDSAWEFGLGSYLTIVGILGLLSARYFFDIKKGVWGAKITLISATLFGISFFVCSVSLASFPSEMMAQTNNAIFNSLFSKFHQYTWDSLNHSPEEAANDLFPIKGEHYERTSSRYPLLKMTRGFVGKQMFHISISEKEKPHVVFLFMESFRARDIGVLGGKYQASPRFDALSKKGILFRKFYANGIQTTRAVMASLFGTLPRLSIRSIQSENPDLPLIGIHHIMEQNGYHTAYIHNGSLHFENKLNFFRDQGFDDIYGWEQIKRIYPNAPSTSWGLHDEYLMRYIVHWLKDKENPVFATVFSVSNHHPWVPPPAFLPTPFPTQKGEYNEFLKSFNYSDAMLGFLMELLEQEQLDNKILLFILGDTAQPMGEHENNFLLINHLFEENIHIPLLILAPGRVNAPAVVDTIGSQVDLLPTLMDILGLQALNHAVGSSLVRDIGDRPVYFLNPFSHGYIGCREGSIKFIHHIGKKHKLLFDLETDPDEQRECSVYNPDRVSQYEERTKKVAHFVNYLFYNRKYAPGHPISTK